MRVLHTPVTSAPNALAICTAKEPTPPDAPVTSTVWPGRTFAMSRNACNAVMADVGTAAASTTDRLAGTGDEVVRRDAGVLRERSSGAPAEHLIARSQISDVLADGCHHAGEVPAGDAVAWPAEPEHQPHHVRLARHDEVVAGMYRGRDHLDEHIASTGQRYPDLGRLEH